MGRVKDGSGLAPNLGLCKRYRGRSAAQPRTAWPEATPSLFEQVFFESNDSAPINACSCYPLQTPCLCLPCHGFSTTIRFIMNGSAQRLV